MDKRTTFINELINSHNIKRIAHGSRRLRCSKKLEDTAQEWATRLLTSSTYDLSLSDEFGESISWKFKSNIDVNGLPSGSSITNDWYDEKRHFDFDGNHYCKGAGHFSQLLWKATKFIGVGIDWNVNGKVVIVVRYKPAGNRAGLFNDNVAPLSLGPNATSTLSDHCTSGSSGSSDIDEVDDARVGTLIHTDTDTVETVDENGRQVKVVTKTEKYLIEDNDIQFLRTIRKRQTHQLTTTNYPRQFDEQVKVLGLVVPAWNPKCETLIPLIRRFQTSMLTAVNAARSSYRSPSVEINDTLNKMAQYWAELRITRPDQVRPRADLHAARVGEILSLVWHVKSETPNAAAVVADWAKGERHYNHQEAIFGTLSGMFTQLVWKASREIGVGFAHNAETHQCLIVSYFYPAGNISGLFAENVPQLSQ